MTRRLLTLLAIALASLSLGAVTPNSFVAPQTPSRGFVRFLQGTDAAGTPKTIYTSGANGSRCYGLWVTQSDSIVHPVGVGVISGGILYTATTVNIPSTAGFAAGIPNVSLMWNTLPVDQYNNFYIQIASGDTLQVYFLTAFSSGGSHVDSAVTCADF